MGAFGSDSRNVTNAPNSSNTASGYAVVSQTTATGRGNTGSQITVNVDRGAAYNVENTYGASAEDLEAGFGSLQESITGLAGARNESAEVEDAIKKALAERAKEQITEGPAESKSFGASNWILVGIGSALLLAAILFGRHRKRGKI